MHNTLQGTCGTHVHIGGTGPRGREQELLRLSFHPSNCPVPCSSVSQRESTFLLPHLIRAIVIITSIHSIHQGTPGRGVTTCDYFSQAKTQTVSTVKKMAFLNRCTGRHVHRWEFPHGLTGRTVKLQEREECWLVLLSKAQSHGCLQPGLQSHERGQIMLLCHSPLGLG